MGKPTPCFMSGARIRAARGDVDIGAIVPGQEVVVVRDGRQVLEPVKWVGYSRIDLSQHANPEEAAPVRFRAGAIAVQQPLRDLVVSPEHCLIIDDLCVPAKLLVNGGSIVSERDHPPFTYFHLELERHGILLAENTPTESYLDTGNRSLFDNADVPRQLHPGFKLNADAARWATDGCAPLVRVPEQVAPIWTRLAKLSATIGFPIPEVSTVDDPDVHLLVGGMAIRPISNRDSRYVFLVPDGAASVSLVSRCGIPADLMIAGQRDTRRLGVRVNWIVIRTSDAETVIPADHPGLDHGWNEVEGSDRTIWRWTAGSATIPWDNVTGPAIVTVRCSPLERYPIRNEVVRLIA
jgi:antigen 43